MYLPIERAQAAAKLYEGQGPPYCGTGIQAYLLREVEKLVEGRPTNPSANLSNSESVERRPD